MTPFLKAVFFGIDHDNLLTLTKSFFKHDHNLSLRIHDPNLLNFNYYDLSLTIF